MLTCVSSIIFEKLCNLTLGKNAISSMNHMEIGIIHFFTDTNKYFYQLLILILKICDGSDESNFNMIVLNIGANE